jgi:hypothetical protein
MQTVVADNAKRKAADEAEKSDIDEAMRLSLTGMAQTNQIAVSREEEVLKPEEEVLKPAAKPAAKRSKEEIQLRQDEFVDRVVNQLSELPDDVTPNTQNLRMEMIDNLAAANPNRYKIIVKSKTAKGTPAEGKSPEVADGLVQMLRSDKAKEYENR